jgi:hypothetical protein
MLFVLIFGIPLLIGIGTFGTLVLNHKIKENAWHVQLMSWLWDVGPEDFTWMCPYAWAMFASVTFIVPILIIGALIKLFMLVSGPIYDARRKYEQYCDEKQVTYWKEFAQACEREYEEFLKTQDLSGKKALLRLYKKSQSNNGVPYGLKWQLKEFDIDYFDILYDIDDAKAKIRYDKKYSPEIVAKKEKVDKVFNKMKYLGKWIAKAFIVTVMIVVSYWIYLAVVWAIGLNWLVVLHMCMIGLYWLLFIASILFIAIVVGPTIFRLGCGIGKYCIPCEERRASIADFFSICWYAITFPFKGIGYFFIYVGKFFVALWNGFVMFKEENCPAIEWEAEEE